MPVCRLRSQKNGADASFIVAQLGGIAAQTGRFQVEYSVSAVLIEIQVAQKGCFSGAGIPDNGDIFVAAAIQVLIGKGLLQFFAVKPGGDKQPWEYRAVGHAVFHPGQQRLVLHAVLFGCNQPVRQLRYGIVPV